MGLGKKASVFFGGIRRRNSSRDEQSRRGPQELKVKSKWGKKKGEQSNALTPEVPKLRQRTARASAIAVREEQDNMGQEQIFSHPSHENRVRRSYHEPAMNAVHPTHFLEDDEEDREEEGQGTDEYDEDEDDIDDSVAEDMKKLEESFAGISQKYRLINRIGEGLFANTPQSACRC